jgi:hypothetical protein
VHRYRGDATLRRMYGMLMVQNFCPPKCVCLEAKTLPPTSHSSFCAALHCLTSRPVPLQPWTQVISIIWIHIRTLTLRHHHSPTPSRLPLSIHTPPHATRTLWPSISTRTKRQPRLPIEVPPIVRIHIPPVHRVAIRIVDWPSRIDVV